MTGKDSVPESYSKRVGDSEVQGADLFSKRTFGRFLLGVFREVRGHRKRVPLFELQTELARWGWHP